MTRRHGRRLRATRELLQRPAARRCPGWPGRARSPQALVLQALALQGAVAAVAETAVRKRRRKAAAPLPLQSVSVRSRSSAWLSPVTPQGQPTSAISGAICHRAAGGIAAAVGADALAAADVETEISAGPGFPPGFAITGCDVPVPKRTR